MNLELNAAHSAQPISFVQREDESAASLNGRLMCVRSEPRQFSVICYAPAANASAGITEACGVKRPHSDDGSPMNQTAPAKSAKTSPLSHSELFDVVLNKTEKAINDFVEDYYKSNPKKFGKVVPPHFLLSMDGLLGKNQPVPNKADKNRLHIELWLDAEGNTKYRLHIVRLGKPIEAPKEYVVPPFYRPPKMLRSRVLTFPVAVAMNLLVDEAPYTERSLINSETKIRARIIELFDHGSDGVVYEEVLAAFPPVARPAPPLICTISDEAPEPEPMPAPEPIPRPASEHVLNLVRERLLDNAARLSNHSRSLP